VSIGRTFAVALSGVSGTLVEIEADLANGLPGLSLIGLPDRALGEAADRVRSAVVNSGYKLPPRRLTVNLSPAAMPKRGSGFDLGIALACLAAGGLISSAAIEDVVHIGELSLDGRLRPTAGVLPAVIAARAFGRTRIMVPSANTAEARLVSGMTVISVSSLREAATAHGAREEAPAAWVELPPLSSVEPVKKPSEGSAALDFSDMVGNDDAIEALIVAAAGGHHLLMTGPPGAGKTMLATRLPGILPDLSEQAALDVASIRSLVGRPCGDALPTRPPLEAPHHTTTTAAMIGGGSGMIRPGSAARASHGVLFLDEAPEFPAAVLDALRQPLESGLVSIHRANAVATFPASFQLVLAANPCPCGNYGSNEADCVCPPSARRRYLGRLSGPLTDRIDIQLRVNRLSLAALRLNQSPRYSTLEAQKRVLVARARSAERLQKTPWKTNAQVSGPFLRSAENRLSASVTSPLDRALERGGLTMRGYDRVLKLAWSIADLDGADRPGIDHVGRALYLRKGMTP
jgi:magnesium chelatase family protein